MKTPLASEPRPPRPAARPAVARGGRRAPAGARDGLRERAPREVQGGALARLHRIQVVHHDDHGPGLLLGDQVVHDRRRRGPARASPARSLPSRAADTTRDTSSSCWCRSRAACRRRRDASVPVTFESTTAGARSRAARPSGCSSRHRPPARAPRSRCCRTPIRRSVRVAGSATIAPSIDRRVVMEADHLRRGRHVPEAVRLFGHVEALAQVARAPSGRPGAIRGR